MIPKEIGVFETKTHLSEIIQKVQEGQTYYITKRGKQVAELRPMAPKKQPFVKGCAKNDGYWMSTDFNEPLEDLRSYME